VVAKLEAAQANRKVMAVNFRLGKIGQIPWTQGWDRYIFLNSYLKETFITEYMKSMGSKRMYSISPVVLPPPTDIQKYLETEIDYSGPMRIVRHSSQNDAKYAKDLNEKIKAILEQFPDATIRLMPKPSFLEDFGDRVIVHQKNKPSVKEFLALGNIYWYDLPDGYHDMGPKTVMEAQASGLPVIANNHSGPKDRVAEDTGFLYNDFEDASFMFEKLNDPVRRGKMGKAAKNHAAKEYDRELWIKEIIGEK